MRVGKWNLIMLGVALAASSTVRAQTPTIEQSLSMKMVGSPRLSPDGRFVAYEERMTDWEQNAFVTQIWLAATATGERRQLTGGKKSNSSPRWSPEGTRLAFVSSREGTSQIYLIAVAGGEAFPLTNVPTGINDFRWSPDGKQIAFTTSDGESKAVKDAREAEGDIQVFPRRDVTQPRTHLWLVDVPPENPPRPVTPRRLTEGQDITVHGFSWSPDSRRIAFSAPTGADADNEITKDIYLVNIANNATRKIVETPGPDGNPQWSPDGKQIAYVTSNGAEGYYYRNSCLAIIPADGGRPTVFTGILDENPGLLLWSRDGIYFSAQQKTYSHLFRLNPTTKAVERLSAPTPIIANGFTFSQDGSQVAFTLADARSAFDVAVSPVKAFAPRRLTDMTAQFRQYTVATREVIAWTSSDGTPIEGVLYKPANFEEGRRYPLLCTIHGGPMDVDTAYIGSSAAYPIEQLVAKGALVLKVNYRGSAGYGEKFRALNIRNLGLGDYADIISGVDSLIAQGMVDRDRVGAMGFSQGGYICAFLTTYSDRFKAVAVGAGISDWTTYYFSTDIQSFPRQYFKATPWDDPEIYRKTSPITYIKRAKTPTLIQHGEADTRVPVANAYELYWGLRDQGVPVKLVVYRGFGHGVYRPKEQRTYGQQTYAWFCQWLWNEKP